MDDILKNKFFWLVLIFTLTNLGFFVFGKIIINKAADAVIEKLQKDYSPSPYGPGFDPDRVDTDVLKNKRLYLQIQQSQINGNVFEDVVSTPDYSIEKKVQFADQWRNGWERERGASLAR